MNKSITAIILSLVMVAACSSSSDPEPAPTGEVCEISEDCAGGVCVLELGTDVSDDPITFEDGYCSNSCSWDEETLEDIGCAEDEVCLEYRLTEEKYCFLEGCMTDYDCRDTNYVCTSLGFFGSLNVCLPADASDSSQQRETTSRPILLVPNSSSYSL